MGKPFNNILDAKWLFTSMPLHVIRILPSTYTILLFCHVLHCHLGITDTRVFTCMTVISVAGKCTFYLNEKCKSNYNVNAPYMQWKNLHENALCVIAFWKIKCAKAFDVILFTSLNRGKMLCPWILASINLFAMLLLVFVAQFVCLILIYVCFWYIISLTFKTACILV